MAGPLTNLAWTCPSCGSSMRLVESQLACTGCGARLRVDGNLVRAVPGFQPSGFPSERVEHLRRLEKRHFWFGPRRRLITRVLVRLGLQRTSPAIELGCGQGGLLGVLASFCDSVIGVEAYETAAASAAATSTRVLVIQGDLSHIPLAAGQFGLVLAADVLEHVTPPALLGEAHRLTSPDAWLMLTVPALPWLWSWADEAAGHRCRYTVDSLKRELADNGWMMMGWTHYQCLLLPLVILTRKVLGRRKADLERRPGSIANALLGAINGFEVAWLGGLRLPWGSSLVAWARRQP